jgi:hypothetical protein
MNFDIGRVSFVILAAFNVNLIGEETIFMQLFSSYFLGRFVVTDNNGNCTFPMTFCLLDGMFTPSF